MQKAAIPMQNRAALYTLILLTALSIAGCEKTENKTELISAKDKAYLLDAADHALFQLNAGQASTRSGGTPAISIFGQTMIDRYSDWNQELQSLATTKNVVIRNSLSNQRQGRLDSLAARRGIDFDTIYVRIMIQSHARAVQMLQAAPDSVEDSNLKNWAISKISQAQTDLIRAKALQDSIKKPSGVRYTF